MKTKQKGVSLIELLIVILVIGSLTGIVFLSTNPTKELAKRRNLQRNVDIKEIAQSIHQIRLHSEGNSYPKTNDKKDIPKCEEDVIPASNLSNTLVPDYLTDIPTDPKDESSYEVCLTEKDKKIKVSAPKAELNEDINIVR